MFIMKHGKKYQGAKAKVEKGELYPIDDAMALMKEVAPAKFDETVEIALKLGVDPRHADQVVRGALMLPHGTGKQVTVMVFAEGEDADKATEAGAEYVGSDELVKKVQDGFTSVDVVIAHPRMMSKVGRLGRILGPRGLMPNPKSGTVTPDVAKAVQEAKAGRVQYRVDRYGNLHVPFGKVSFEAQQLTDNALAIVAAALRDKPAAAKGQYMQGITVSSTMGPGIKIDPSDAILKAKK